MEKQDVVVMTYSDFVTLNRQAKAVPIEQKIIIPVREIIFLTEIVIQLSVDNVLVFSFINDTVKIDVETENGKLKAIFDISLCKKYEYNVKRFIAEVL